MASKLSQVQKRPILQVIGTLYSFNSSLFFCQSLATYTRLWYLIDAQHQVNGRLAVMLSLLLQGKTKPIYHPAGDAFRLLLLNCVCIII